MPITTIDEWNQASFKEAFYECFSEQFGYNEPFRQGLFAYITNVLPGHKALACRAFNDNMIFYSCVFASRNYTIPGEITIYISGIESFNASARELLGDYSRQYSHSERAIGSCFHLSAGNLHIINLLIKNQSPTCPNCQRFLRGNAKYITRIGDANMQIEFIPDGVYCDPSIFVEHTSASLLQHGLRTIVSVGIQYEGEYECA